MTTMTDHPLRYAIANELHARPFPTIDAPAHAVYVVFKTVDNAATRDRAADFEHLTRLLDHYAAPHPEPGATHYTGTLGRQQIKWESHTEFVSYTIFGAGTAASPFDGRSFRLFPENWLDEGPGARITSAMVRIERNDDDADIAAKLDDWFVPESLAAARVLDGQLVVAGDFRIDPSGHMRFAVFAGREAGPQRIGRVVQRICEIETYKAMSMLGFARARAMGGAMSATDERLYELTDALSGGSDAHEDTLEGLLKVSAEIEKMTTQSAFRFGATAAYETIVRDRVQVLREERFEARQTLSEFMTRRFEPAMRTVRSTEDRLKAMSARAVRAAELLRTRVDVDRAQQNQRLLESMDRRSDMALRLQKTVEGLSVVAISYYAVNLAANMATPFAGSLGTSSAMLKAALTPPVILLVWWMIRQIRKAMDR